MNKFFGLLIIVISCACKHKTNFNSLPTVSYSTNIEPVIVSNCTQSGCHGGEEHRSFSLLSYDDVINHTGITAGNPDKSKLYKVIDSYNAGTVMPRKPYNKLTEEQIELIYVWIGQGAKNN